MLETASKQRRSKQGDLAGLINMPIEIFAEVASHLHPADILSLARSSRLLRSFLMNRSAVYIWHRAMRSVKGLPPCPPVISEPYYVSLLFSKTCSVCGVPTRVQVEPLLLLRLCRSCQCTYLMPLNNIPAEISLLALRTTNVNRARPNAYAAHAPRDYFEQHLAEYEEKKRSKDVNALQVWKEERMDILEKRNDYARGIIQFFETIRLDRAQEARETQCARESEIVRQLKQIGWSEEDLGFTSHSPIWHRWRELVSSSRPLTDRIWTRLRPKLIALLEENREYRLAMERGNRKNMRHSLLSNLLADIYTKGYPAITLKARDPVTRCAIIDFTHRGAFPSFNHTLDWPIVKTLCETDLTEVEMKDELEKHRDEIEALVAAWVSRIQTHFVHQLRKGYANQAQALRPAITMHDIGQPADIPNNLKYLLRADSFFCRAPSHPSGWPPKPLSYDTFICTEGLDKFYPKSASLELWAAPKLGNIVWYPSAHRIAQELLSSMGRPDATYLEMMSVGPKFACGRCHESRGRNWDEMVQHYIEQRNQHAMIQNTSSHISSGVVYKDVHSPASLPDQPMVTNRVSKIMPSQLNIWKNQIRVCNICEMLPCVERVLTSPSAMLEHLLDVHGIYNPQVGYHYSVHPREQ